MSFVANTPAQRSEMLQACGVHSVDEFFACIPESVRPRSFDIPPPKSELEIYEFFRDIARRNYSHLTNFLGGGVYDHFIPAAVDAVSSRSEFYTAYTPYQPEMSQGTLQAIYEYQTSICRLTGMQASNASLYDGGSALFEACKMAVQATGRKKVVVDGNLNPVHSTMLCSYSPGHAIDLKPAPRSLEQVDRSQLLPMLDDQTAAVVLQNPNFFGVVDDYSDVAKHCHEKGILVIMSVYPISLALLKSPGEMGADIVTGEGQSLGIPLSFGGPYLGFMTTTRELVRKMPGRIVGRTTDRNGREAFVLTLQAREQHIRREKATSNICSNEALCALRAHLYMSLLGKEGLKSVARLCHAKTRYAMERIGSIPGVTVGKAPVFNEFVARLPKEAGEVAGGLVERGIAPGLPLSRFFKGMNNYLLIAVTEKRNKFEIGSLAEALEAVLCR
jgi:glycine dehydrogenase subunit 1